jgi:hypothetical protein
MSKSLKQEQDELFAGLEDILPNPIELSYETRGKKTSSTVLNRTEEQKAKQDIKNRESRKRQGEKMRKKYADPAYKEKYIESRKHLYTDPEFKRKQTEGNRRSAKDPVAYKNRVEAIRKSAQDPKIKEIRKEVGKKLSQNKEWCKAAGERNKKRCMKPIFTPEGIFAGLNLAAKRYNEIKNQKSTQNWLMNQIKNDPTNFYYISKEEYIMLTGKEI